MAEGESKPLFDQFVPVRSASDAEAEAALVRGIEACFERGDLRAANRGVALLTLFCSRTGRQRRAVPYLDRLVSAAQGPGQAAGALLKAGQLLEQVDDYEAATTYYERGLALGPVAPVVRYYLCNNFGFCLNYLGRHAEAERLCRDAIEVSPRPHNAHKNLAIALEAQGRLAPASSSFLDAAERAPQDPRALMHLEALLAANPTALDDHPTLQQRLARCREEARRVREGLH